LNIYYLDLHSIGRNALRGETTCGIFCMDQMNIEKIKLVLLQDRKQIVDILIHLDIFMTKLEMRDPYIK